MKLLIPVWENRVAPVFDSACEMVIVTVNNDSWELSERFILEGTPEQKVSAVGLFEADILICGAIPFRYERILETIGWEVIPFKKGELAAVIESFCRGSLENDPAFAMPGCTNRENRCRFNDSTTQRFNDSTKF